MALFGQVQSCSFGASFRQPRAVGNRVLLHVEADLRFWRSWWRFEEGTQFLVNVTKGGIMDQEGFVDFSETLKDGGIGGLILAQFDESADDVNAHGDGARAVQDVGGLQRAMFGERLWKCAASTSSGL